MRFTLRTQMAATAILGVDLAVGMMLLRSVGGDPASRAPASVDSAMWGACLCALSLPLGAFNVLSVYLLWRSMVGRAEREFSREHGLDAK